MGNEAQVCFRGGNNIHAFKSLCLIKITQDAIYCKGTSGVALPKKEKCSFIVAASSSKAWSFQVKRWFNSRSQVKI